MRVRSWAYTRATTCLDNIWKHIKISINRKIIKCREGRGNKIPRISSWIALESVCVSLQAYSAPKGKIATVNEYRVYHVPKHVLFVPAARLRCLPGWLWLAQTKLNLCRDQSARVFVHVPLLLCGFVGPHGSGAQLVRVVWPKTYISLLVVDQSVGAPQCLWGSCIQLCSWGKSLRRDFHLQWILAPTRIAIRGRRQDFRSRFGLPSRVRSSRCQCFLLSVAHRSYVCKRDVIRQ